MAVSIINVNSVTGVRVECAENGKFNIFFIPDFTFSSPGAYSGNFYVKLTNALNEAVGELITVEYKGNATTHTLSEVNGITSGERYNIAVSGDNSFPSGKFKTAIVTTLEYSSPHLVFRNDTLTIKWEQSLYAHGELNVSGDWNTAMPIPFGIKGYTLPLTSEIYGSAHFRLKVAACIKSKDDTSLGPFCAPIDAHLTVPVFNKAEFSGTTLTVDCSLPESIADKYTVYLGLALNGEEPDLANLSAPKPNTVSSYDISAYNTLEGYTAYLFAKSKAEAANGVPLFANYNIAKANRFSLANPNVWQKGYYPVRITSGTKSKTMLLYAESQADLAESKNTLTYSLPLYVDFLEGKSIAVDGLTLEKSGTKLLLTIDKEKLLAAAAFKQFLSGLFDLAKVEKAIEPQAYYALRSFICRTALFSDTDANYILHGIGAVTETVGGKTVEKYRYEDILPGSVFRVQTSGFRRQTDPKAQALQGYYQNSQLDYHVEYNTAAKRLDFDANLSLLVGSWSYMNAELSTAREETYGGALDLALENLQKPYARLVNSGGFFPSDSMDDGLGAATGMSVFFGDDIPALNAVSDLSRATVPNLSFRGRAALTICVTVFFGGNPLVIPAGTTLGAFAARYGISNLDKAKLKRRNFAGEPVCVNAPLSEIAAMPLINGDAVE